jgi:hypothetical protein
MRMLCADLYAHALLALQQVADGGNDLGRDAEVAQVIEDQQFGPRDEFGGVVGVDDVDDAVPSAVQDGCTRNENEPIQVVTDRYAQLARHGSA